MYGLLENCVEAMGLHKLVHAAFKQEVLIWGCSLSISFQSTLRLQSRNSMFGCHPGTHPDQTEWKSLLQTPVLMETTRKAKSWLIFEHSSCVHTHGEWIMTLTQLLQQNIRQLGRCRCKWSHYPDMSSISTQTSM